MYQIGHFPVLLEKMGSGSSMAIDGIQIGKLDIFLLSKLGNIVTCYDP